MFRKPTPGKGCSDHLLVLDAATPGCSQCDYDMAFDQMDFLLLADATQARIIYHNTVGYDQSQNALLYRRDLIYTVEYPTMTTAEQPSMLFGTSDLNSNITYG
jgi:hypothetical protein